MRDAKAKVRFLVRDVAVQEEGAIQIGRKRLQEIMVLVLDVMGEEQFPAQSAGAQASRDLSNGKGG